MTSHTSTGEWKSFEVRMRQRRAERLLVRAETAAAEGFLDEAGGALAEARRLSADPAEAARVERMIAAARRGKSAHRAATRARGVYIAAGVATLLVLSALAGAYWAYRTTRRGLPTSTASALVPAEPPAAPVPALPVRVVTASVAPEIILARPVDAADADAQPEQAAVALPVPEQPDLHRNVAQPENAPAPPERRRDSGATLLPVPGPVQQTEERIDARVRALPDAPKPIADLTPPPSSALAPASSSEPAPSPAPVVNNDAVLVRGVLEKYASAYTRLDAEAARAAWPTVDVAALARAFDGLASQQIALGDCSVDVNGGSARAACVGTTTWRPKVGGGVRTDARVWTFDLARAGGNWQIVSARVQKR